MRTVLERAARRATFILVTTGMVGSAALLAVPTAAEAATHRHHPAHHARQTNVQIGTAVKYVRNADGTVQQVR